MRTRAASHTRPRSMGPRGPEATGSCCSAQELGTHGDGWQPQQEAMGLGTAHRGPCRSPEPHHVAQTHLWMPSTSATSSGEDEMYTQDFPESGDFLGPSTWSSSFTCTVWQRQRARKKSSSRSCEDTARARPHHSLERSLPSCPDRRHSAGQP